MVCLSFKFKKFIRLTFFISGTLCPVVHTSSPLEPVSPFCPAGPVGPGIPCNERDNDCTFEIIIIQLMILDQWDLRLKNMLCYVGAHDKHPIAYGDYRSS